MKKFTKMWAIAACALFAGTAAVNAEDYTWKFVTAGDIRYPFRRVVMVLGMEREGAGRKWRIGTYGHSDVGRWKPRMEKGRWRESIRLLFG